MRRSSPRRTTVVLDIDPLLDAETEYPVHEPWTSDVEQWLEQGANIVFCTKRPSAFFWEHVWTPLVPRLASPPAGDVFLVSEHGAEISQLVRQPGERWPNEVKRRLTRTTPHQAVITAALEKACRRGQLAGAFRRDPRFHLCFDLSKPFADDPRRLLPDWIARRVPQRMRLVSTCTSLAFLHPDARKEFAVRFLFHNYSVLAGSRAVVVVGETNDFAWSIPGRNVDCLFWDNCCNLKFDRGSNTPELSCIQMWSPARDTAVMPAQCDAVSPGEST